MKLSIPQALRDLEQSDIRTMSIECDKVGGLNLSQGICDLDTPPEVLEGARAAISAGQNFYTRFDGIPELRQAIARKLKRENGIVADPEKNIIVSGGATGALFAAGLACLRPGDEVVLFEPYYGYHLHTLLAIGAKPVYVRTHPPDWRLDIAELEKAITPKTKAILLNTPSNPSGKVFGKKELEAIGDVCQAHDLLVFTDEIYEYFVYDGREHVSPASVPSLRERTITVSGYSKTFSITGWRIGYCVCPDEIAAMVGPINDLIYVCAPAPLQYGVAAGLRALAPAFFENIRKTYQGKRDRLCATLHDIGLTPYVPQGAYYVLVDAAKLSGAGSHEKAMNLLRKTGVATVPGRAFYHDPSGENLIRICFAKKEEDLEEACRRLRRLE